VWSISYGGPEFYQFYMDVLNKYFALLGACGITVTASSGDSGAGFQPPFISPIDAPAVAFPASSPYVLAVGATAKRLTNAGIEEVACSAADTNIITSGGGFSQSFGLPPFQCGAVMGYLQQLAGKGYPQTLIPTFTPMRGVPDVAAIGAWVNIVVSNTTTPVFGTSIASPVLASLISLMNHARRLNNLSASVALGTSFFYAAALEGLLTDITLGSNCAGQTSAAGLFSANFPTYAWDQCYNTSAGWDPVTGMGHVANFTELLRFALQWNSTMPGGFPCTASESASTSLSCSPESASLTPPTAAPASPLGPKVGTIVGITAAAVVVLAGGTYFIYQRMRRGPSQGLLREQADGGPLGKVLVQRETEEREEKHNRGASYAKKASETVELDLL
jgi:hypothetical protein